MRNITFEGAFWCLSDLNVDVSAKVCSVYECWDACRLEYETTAAVDYYPETKLCFCQDDCRCFVRSDEIAQLIIDESITIPNNCSQGSDDDSLDPTLRIADEQGWCKSGLDERPQATVDSPQSCWNACQAEFGSIVAVDYYPDASCFCQDGCECLFNSADTEVQLVVNKSFNVPGPCEAELDPGLRYADEAGLCKSGLNESPAASVNSAQACWSACHAEFGSIVAVHSYTNGSCFCQDACECLVNTSDTHVRLVVNQSLQLPSACDADGYPPGSGGDDDDSGSDYVNASDFLNVFDDLDAADDSGAPDDINATDCIDSELWFADDDPTIDCAWVATNFSMCSLQGNGTRAYEACRKSCGSCVKECNATQADSPTWYADNRPSKDCKFFPIYFVWHNVNNSWAAGEWVSDYTFKRCHLKDALGTPAWVACPFSCKTCEFLDGDCTDDVHWRSATSSFVDVQDCDWVGASKLNRCKTAGADGFGYAYEACRRSCHSCKLLLTGMCEDSTIFFKKGEPSKNCHDWVAKLDDFIPSRCTVKGETNDWAYDRCSLTCKTC